MRTTAIALIVVGMCVAQSAGAQGKPKEPAAPPPPPPPPTAAADLQSGNPAKIKGALDDIRIGGKANARFAPIIAQVLQKGLNIQTTEAAIETLGDLESDAGTAVIIPYVLHRNVKIRQSAVKALMHTKGKAAIAPLRKALADQDPMVRGIAANALGTLNAKEAVDDLFLALDHRINEAATSIGMMCNPEQCANLATRLGKQPFDVISSGIDQAMFRKDVPEDTKIKLLSQVREMGTPDANKFLKSVLGRWPKDGSARIKQALEQAVGATGG